MVRAWERPDGPEEETGKKDLGTLAEIVLGKVQSRFYRQALDRLCQWAPGA